MRSGVEEKQVVRHLVVSTTKRSTDVRGSGGRSGLVRTIVAVLGEYGIGKDLIREGVDKSIRRALLEDAVDELLLPLSCGLSARREARNLREIISDGAYVFVYRRVD